MAGIVAVIVKMMPEGVDIDVEGWKGKVTEILEGDGAQNISYEVKDVAFGLRALMVKFAWSEEKDSSLFEDKLAAIEGVSSAVTDDYRRAFG